MKLVTILIISVLIASPVILAEKAFAEYNTTTKEYSCNSSDMQASKSDYSYFVYQVNKYWSGERPEDIATTILKSTYPSPMLINLGISYQCLQSINIDPDSIAKIQPEVLQGLYMAKEQDPVKFSQIAPDFDTNVPIPEFGPLAGLIIAMSTVAMLVFSKRSKI
ncbi:MAG: hypothetical protein KGH76_03870 [Thaumarchaeota archaeon]|nr:hypothetical protein [Nitrososphaerota archaeon]